MRFQFGKTMAVVASGGSVRAKTTEGRIFPFRFSADGDIGTEKKKIVREVHYRGPPKKHLITVYHHVCERATLLARLQRYNTRRLYRERQIYAFGCRRRHINSPGIVTRVSHHPRFAARPRNNTEKLIPDLRAKTSPEDAHRRKTQLKGGGIYRDDPRRRVVLKFLHPAGYFQKKKKTGATVLKSFLRTLLTRRSSEEGSVPELAEKIGRMTRIHFHNTLK